MMNHPLTLMYVTSGKHPWYIPFTAHYRHVCLVCVHTIYCHGLFIDRSKYCLLPYRFTTKFKWFETRYFPLSYFQYLQRKSQTGSPRRPDVVAFVSKVNKTSCLLGGTWFVVIDQQDKCTILSSRISNFLSSLVLQSRSTIVPKSKGNYAFFWCSHSIYVV